MNNSPRIGSSVDVTLEVVILANDNPNGIIEFEKLEIFVGEENGTSPFIKVSRKKGAFGKVSIRYKIKSESAILNEDFTVLDYEVKIKWTLF